jgi:UDP-N-acetylmuramate dehydrogenase
MEGTVTIRTHEPMSHHTSWKVGGSADVFYQPKSLEELCAFLEKLPAQEPLTWVGLGSNLLVRDGGIRGTVIGLSGVLNTLELDDDGKVRAEAGVNLARLSRFADREELSGLEFAIGIPGTVGGALAMNAGAFGSEIWSWVSEVETIDRFGTVRQRYPEDFEIGYRHVLAAHPGEWFVAASFLLDPKQSRTQEMKVLLQKRNASQPIGQASCGSVFRNPEGNYAGRLIEEAGLKGHKIGGAMISDKHANFIINTGDASAKDIEDLIELAQETVWEQCGIRLQPEVKILGEGI